MLFQLGLAPAVIILFYIYIRDKYEKEPIKLLITGILFGVIITAPIVFTENLIMHYLPYGNKILDAFLTSFVVASFVEETYKYIILYFLIWKNKNFNEKFDGIVYSAFISLGFAGIENILYVLNPQLGGFRTAVSRAVFSVPGHGLFGVYMGYYFALAKFDENKKIRYMLYAFIVPFIFHGVYDFILLSQIPYAMIIFIFFVIFMWITGFKKMKKHIKASPFKTKSNKDN